jgi:hypothetical protein
VRILICSMPTQNTSRATSPGVLFSYLLIKRRSGFLLADSQFGTFFSCSSNSMKVPSVVYAHSERRGSCSLLILNVAEAALFILLRPPEH